MKLKALLAVLFSLMLVFGLQQLQMLKLILTRIRSQSINKKMTMVKTKRLRRKNGNESKSRLNKPDELRSKESPAQ
jgi:hypothetical protein